MSKACWGRLGFVIRDVVLTHCNKKWVKTCISLEKKMSQASVACVMRFCAQKQTHYSSFETIMIVTVILFNLLAYLCDICNREKIQCIDHHATNCKQLLKVGEKNVLFCIRLMIRLMMMDVWVSVCVWRKNIWDDFFFGKKKFHLMIKYWGTHNIVFIVCPFSFRSG